MIYSDCSRWRNIAGQAVSTLATQKCKPMQHNLLQRWMDGAISLRILRMSWMMERRLFLDVEFLCNKQLKKNIQHMSWVLLLPAQHWIH
jgi:hypothetical protein